MKSISYLLSAILLAIIGNAASMQLEESARQGVVTSWEQVKKLDGYETLIRESFYTQ